MPVPIGGDRVYVCSCFGITEQQVRQHAKDGRCSPRQIASACKAGTDCGSCVKRIQAILGRDAGRATPRPRPVPAVSEPAAVPEAPGPTAVPQAPQAVPHAVPEPLRRAA
jgi:bacterioferritin-associated ferredoxin